MLKGEVKPLIIWDYIKQNSLASYAAAVATISLFWHVYSILRDKAKIVLKIEKNRRIVSHNNDNLYNPNIDYIILNVINKGRRPIKITQAGIKVYNSKEGKNVIIFSDSFLPTKRVLTEENPSTNFACDQSKIDLNNIEYLWARDGADKIYKKYIHSLPVVKKIFSNMGN